MGLKMRTVHGEVYPIGSAIYSNNRPISHNQGYKSNKNQINDASSNFYFQERLGQINWREVNRLDVDKIIKDVDLNAIQRLLRNVAFAKLDEDDVDRFGDSAFIKLFRISQLTIEYLLFTQDYLTRTVKGLETEHQQTSTKNIHFTQKVKLQNNELKALRKELRIKNKTISTYEHLIKQPNAQIKDKVYPCRLCTDKFFASREFLETHFKRRHPDSELKEAISPQKMREKEEAKSRDETMTEVKLAMEKAQGNLNLRLDKTIEDFRLSQEKKELLMEKEYEISRRELGDLMNEKINSAMKQIGNILTENEVKKGDIGQKEPNNIVTKQEIETMLLKQFNMLNIKPNEIDYTAIIRENAEKFGSPKGPSPFIYKEEQEIIKSAEKESRPVDTMKSAPPKPPSNSPKHKQNEGRKKEINKLPTTINIAEKSKGKNIRHSRSEVIIEEMNKKEEHLQNTSRSLGELGNLSKLSTPRAKIVISPRSSRDRLKHYILQNNEDEMGEIMTYYQHSAENMQKEMEFTEEKMMKKAEVLVEKLELSSKLIHENKNVSDLSKDRANDTILTILQHHRKGNSNLENTVKEVKNNLEEIILNSKSMKINESMFGSARSNKEEGIQRPATGNTSNIRSTLPKGDSEPRPNTTGNYSTN